MSFLRKKRFIIILTLTIAFIISASHSTLLSQEYDRSKIKRLRWVGPGRPGTYEEYIASFPKVPFFVSEIFKPPIPEPITAVQKVLVIVNSAVYSELEDKILRYTGNLIWGGYYVELYESSGGTPEALKSFIKGKEDNLIGCVLIGSLPTAWYEVANDYEEYGYAEFPCDLFLMDLDGTWIDSNTNGKYDSHSDGSGDVRPEIFVGRIDASQMPGNEYNILSSYFDKNYNYWSGGIYLLKYGLTYTEDDWAIYDYFKHDISYLYNSDYKAIAAPDTNRNDYLNNRLKNITYEFIQLACHSSSGGHSFTRGGWLLSDDIRYAPPKGLGYNLFCCSGLRFTDYNFLGGAYIFNAGAKALVTIGSTKTGSMLQFHYFYESLGNNNPMGIAFKEWFEQISPWDKWVIYWHYGMSIIGDPMVILDKTIPDVIAGQGPGAASYVRDFYAPDGDLLNGWKAFGAGNVNGEVSVAKGNVTGDCLPEIVVAQRSSTGANSYVRVFSQDGTLLWAFQAFGAGNVNGMVNVAVGDVDLDGYGEIIVGQGPGGQSCVRIFEYGCPIPNVTWQAFGASNVNGEVRVAAGHTVAAVLVGQIITAQGPGGQSYVRVWDYGSPPTLRKTFQAFGGANTSGGVDVGVGNFDNHASSRDLIVVGQGGPGGTAAGPAGSYVRIFAGNGALLKTIKAFGASNTKGRVTVSGGQADTDAADEIIVGQAVGGDSYYRTFNYDGSLILTVKAFGASNTNGQVDVAGYKTYYAIIIF